MNSPIEPTATSRQPIPGRRWLWIGSCLPVLAIIVYAVQLSRGRLPAPWYMPVLATLGLILVIVAVREARSIRRWLVLAMVLLLAGAEWTFVLATRLPPYSGPATVGKPLQSFTTSRADGSPFSEQDLKGDRNHAVVFFRGRW